MSADRLLAKKYLRTILAAPDGSHPGLPKTERECVEMLIASHRRLLEDGRQRDLRALQRGWFGRLLWHWFGRWL